MSLGELTKIEDTSIICPGDVAVYQCNVSNSVLAWELYLMEDTITIVLEANRRSVCNDTLGSSPVSAQLIFENSTSLTSTLSLQVALQLNGTIVVCGGNTLTLNIKCKE